MPSPRKTTAFYPGQGARPSTRVPMAFSRRLIRLSYALAQQFAVDKVGLKEASLTAAARLAKNASENRTLAESWRSLTWEAIEEDRYEDAQRYLPRALAAADKIQALEPVLGRLSKFPTNADFLKSF